MFVVAAVLGGHGARVPGHDAGGGTALPRSHPRARLLHLPLREYLLSTLHHHKVSELSLPYDFCWLVKSELIHLSDVFEAKFKKQKSTFYAKEMTL